MTHERALIAIFALSTLLLTVALVREARRRRGSVSDEALLFPFDISTFSAGALDRSIKIAKGSGATLLPAYLAVVSRRVSLDASLPRHAERAIPMLDRIEVEANRQGVRVDSSIESGRSLRHALARVIEARHPDQAIIAAAAAGQEGFSPEDIAWILDRVNCGVLVLKPPT
ncbi:MAG: universal stress protein [Solirubrobacterales bacterium]|nr:universal stress protein [Solirubrobacterales bacterium]